MTVSLMQNEREVITKISSFSKIDSFYTLAKILLVRVGGWEGDGIE